MDSWTTAHASRPVSAWTTHLAEAYVPLKPAWTPESPFFGRIAKIAAGPVAISRVDASAHRVQRCAEHIRAADPGIAFVNLQIEGIGVSAQDDREVRCGPGDVAIVDTRRPFAIHHGDRFALYCIALANDAVPEALRVKGSLRLSGSDRGRVLAGMMAGYARIALDDAATPEARALYGHHLVELLDLASVDTKEAPQPGQGGPERRALILECLRSRYRDPTLSARKVGRLFGVSARYVHKLMASTGASFSEHLRDARLDAAAAALGDSACTVARVAAECGFSDLSYFNRTFKSRFGEPPSLYRRRMDADARRAAV